MFAAVMLLLGAVAGYRHSREGTGTPTTKPPRADAAERRSVLDNRTPVRYGRRHKEVPVTKHDAARKQKIIDFIAATVRDRGYPPSVREIAAAVDLASTSAVHHHLQALEREGYLERGASHSRALRLTPQAALRAGLSDGGGGTRRAI